MRHFKWILGSGAGIRTWNLELIRPALSPIELRRPVVDGRTYSSPRRVGARKADIDAALRGRANDDGARPPRLFGWQRRIEDGGAIRGRLESFSMGREELGHRFFAHHDGAFSVRQYRPPGRAVPRQPRLEHGRRRVAAAAPAYD